MRRLLLGQTLVQACPRRWRVSSTTPLPSSRQISTGRVRIVFIFVLLAASMLYFRVTGQLDAYTKVPDYPGFSLRGLGGRCQHRQTAKCLPGDFHPDSHLGRAARGTQS